MFNIPIFINNFNRLTTTRKLVADLNNLGYSNITIIDNASTYPPLIDWYKHEYNGNIIVAKNLGSRALWHPDIRGLVAMYSENHPYIIYTDADIELNPNMPKSFASEMQRISEKFGQMKVGLSLRLDDLPNNELCNKIQHIEAPYWKARLHDNQELYRAPVDTTFCMIKTGASFTYTALRLAGEYTCRHMPWYKPFDAFDEEEKYIMDAADINICTTKQHYFKWLENEDNRDS